MRCTIGGCRSESYAGCLISFHSFPKDEILRRKWIAAIGEISFPDKKKICHKHFKENDFEVTACRRKLKLNAIPSMFLGCEVTPSRDMSSQQADPVVNMIVEPEIHMGLNPSPTNEGHVGDVQDNIERGFCTQIIKEELNTENASFEDEELDYSIQSSRSLTNGSLESYISKSYRSLSSDLQDIMSKSVGIELPPINFYNDRQTATGTKNLKPTDIDHASSSANSGSIKKVRKNTGEAIHKCDTCGRGFRRSYDLTVHIRTHTGEKPYKCETCGKRFRRKNHLSDHIPRHLIDKLYKCSTCGRDFSQKRDLSQHIRLHTGEQPFKCNICGLCFNRNGSLADHIRKHTGEKPFKCDECGKCFTRKSGFWVHLRTHTGEKPYKCDTCGKGFSLKYALLVHIRTHTGERPYKCKICKSRFQSNATLARHVRTSKGKCKGSKGSKKRNRTQTGEIP